jgi:hypothetical protein
MPGGGFARLGSHGLGISEDRAVGVPKICLQVHLLHMSGRALPYVGVLSPGLTERKWCSEDPHHVARVCRPMRQTIAFECLTPFRSAPALLLYVCLLREYGLSPSCLFCLATDVITWNLPLLALKTTI